MSEQLLPMLAKPLPTDFNPSRFPTGQFVAEEKFDGLRMMVSKQGDEVSVWSRTGKLGGTVARQIQSTVEPQLHFLTDGIYDGELLVRGDGCWSSAVTEIANRSKLVYMLFDMVQVGGVDATSSPYRHRRLVLEVAYSDGFLNQLPKGTAPRVELASVYPISTRDDITTLAQGVWDRGGEGLIIKNTSAPYAPGKRRDAFMKVKECGSDVLTVVGWIAGETEKQNRGPFARTVLRSDDGILLAVKTLDTQELEQFAQRSRTPDFLYTKVQLDGAASRDLMHNGGGHPDLGRKLRIEYHMRTPDGNYRSPRWDRWEDQ